MSLVEELESKVPTLTPDQLADFRDWFDQYVENRMELRDETKLELDRAWEEIGRGSFRSRQTPSA